MFHFSKLIHYIEKAAVYPLTTYVRQYRKGVSLFLFLLIFAIRGLLTSILLGALIDPVIFFCLLLFFPLMIISILCLCYVAFCLQGAKECQKILKQINQEIVFIDQIYFFDVKDKNYLIHVLKELIRSKNLVNYRFFSPYFLYQADLEVNEKELLVDNQLVQFEMTNKKILPKYCPNCHHVLFYNQKKCHYCE